MIFTSRAAESYDERPYVTQAGQRMSAREYGILPSPLRENFVTYAPREDFEPTQDENPWALVDHGEVIERFPSYPGDHPDIEWLPRDRRRSRVLIAFREAAEDPYTWFHQLGMDSDKTTAAWRALRGIDITPEEIAHARKVLGLLARLS